jgi:ABC-type transport system involved in cytochrome c biogenesis permease subunit
MKTAEQTVEVAMTIVLAAFLWSGVLQIAHGLRMLAGATATSQFIATVGTMMVVLFVTVAAFQLAEELQKDDPDYSQIGLNGFLQPIFTAGVICLTVWASR